MGRDIERSERHMYLMDSDGSDARPLYPMDSLQLESAPSWSPDGQSIVVAVRPVGDHPYQRPAEIVILDTLGASRRTVASGYQPSWSPTGEWIAYLAVRFEPTSGAAGATGVEGLGEVLETAIRLVRPDGTRDYELYTGEESVENPRESGMTRGFIWGRLVWSSDGSRLAFSVRSEHGSTIHGVRTDGREVVQLVGEERR